MPKNLTEKYILLILLPLNIFLCGKSLSGPLISKSESMAPPVGFYVQLPNDSTICSDIRILLKAKYYNNTGKVKFKWSTGDTTKLNILTGNITKDTLFYFTATDSLGATSSDSIKITIIPSPVITFSSVPIACDNDTNLILLDNFVTPKGGTWYMDTSFLVGGNKYNQLLSGAGYFWVRYNFKDGVTGCVDTNFLQVIINPSPVAGFSFYTYSGKVPLRVRFTNTSYSKAGATLSHFWDFNDGNTSILKNPLHIFINTGTAKICLTETDDINMCSKSWCDSVKLVTGTGLLDLGGFVYKDTVRAQHCPVYLITYDSQSTDYQIADTTSVIDSNGFYLFTGLNPGKYLVKSLPETNSPDYGKYFPTYSTSSIFWQKADMINLTANGYDYDIFLEKANPSQGNGRIEGKVLKNNEPAENIQLMLVNNLDAPVRYYFSDGNGDFIFQNLPFNTYRVYAELLGIRTYSGQIPLDTIHSVVNNIIIQLISGLPEEQAAASDHLDVIFTNPVSGKLKLWFYSESENDYEMRVMDVTGKVRLSGKYHAARGENTMEMDLSELNNGIYIINMLMKGYLHEVFKIIKTF